MLSTSLINTKINPFSENGQSVTIATYNENRKDKDKIPLVIRNFHTGWPLLQVTLLSADISTPSKVKYAPILNGEKCHYLFVGAFNLALLLTKVPGKFTVDHPSFKIENLEIITLKGYEIQHATYKMTIQEINQGRGKTLEITLPVEGAKEFKDHLSDATQFALRANTKFNAIGGVKTDQAFTEKQLLEKINPDTAIFYNGQFFIDFGVFINKIEKPELTDYFGKMFKVNEFLTLKETNLTFKPFSPLSKQTSEEKKGSESPIESPFKRLQKQRYDSIRKRAELKNNDELFVNDEPKPTDDLNESRTNKRAKRLF